MRGALSRLEFDGFVYLDDTLLVARHSEVGRDAFLVAPKLRKGGFLISPKLVMEPTQRINFIGKWFDSATGSISNRQGLIVGIIGLWSLAVLRPSDEKLMSRMLGRLKWALRPNGGVSAFLAGAY